MYEWIFLFAPGACSYITAVKMSGRKSSSTLEGVLEWLFLCGIDTVLLWLLAGADASATLQAFCAEATGADLLQGLLGGLAVGVVDSFLRQIRITAWVDRESPGLMEKASPGLRKVLRRLGGLILMILLLLAVCWPRIRQEQTKARETSYRDAVLTTYQELQQTLEQHAQGEEDLQNPGDIDTSVLTVRQVTKDQHWSREGSGLPGREAVYMVDGDGTLVYYSFRDETHGTTWSGPSQDSAFLSSNGGWNGGMGFGWTGYKVQ